jgi:two-component system phosphate regulon sensor histidine kinase PhoR
MLTHFLEGLPEAELDPLCKAAGRASATRLTLIDRDGRVLGESDGDPRLIENHASRPEVAEALRGRRGTSIRHSTTVNATMMYVAIPVFRGGEISSVVRVALPLTDVEAAYSSLRRSVLFGGLVVALAAAGISLLASRWISLPLERLRAGAERFAQGELGFRLAEHGTSELRDVSEALNAMARQLQERIDRLAAQRRELEALLSSMTEGVIGVDGDERVVALNRAAAELFQVDAAAAKGKALQEVVRNAELQKFVRTVLGTGRPPEEEVVIEERDRFLRANGTVLREAGGGVVLNDVTRLRKLETVRRDFVANVSHELKTPITAIQGFLETLREAGSAADPAESARFLQIVSRHADRLNAIIEDLLMLSRLEQESERSEILLERGSIRAVVASAIRDCEPKANQRGVTLRVDAPEEIEAPINGPLLEHAVANLVDNAIKFSPRGGTVDVRVSREEAGARIRVEDRGPGIPAEHLPRIFERFYRVDQSRSRKEGGTGLGLAIVKHVVLAHRGAVSVESEAGRGSAFTIRIPAAGGTSRGSRP